MHIELKKICVPTDFSEHSEYALRYAVTLASQFSAELHLLHIVQDIVPTVPEPGLAILPTDEIMRSLEKGAEEGLNNFVPKEWAEQLNIVRVIRHGVPFHEICQYAKQSTIDLLVLATHGRSGLAHFLLGSVAERVVRSAPCPVLTIRHPEHEFIVPE
jgi:nucleotide-binding universal stress UspA family protein